MENVHIVELPEPPAQLDEIRQSFTVARELLGQWRRANPGRQFPPDDPQQMTEHSSRAFYRRRGGSFVDRLPQVSSTCREFNYENRNSSLLLL